MLNTTVRKMRDTLFSLQANEQWSVKVKLMSAVQAYRSITVKNVYDAFKETDLWPMRFDFADRFWTASDARREHAEGIKMETEVGNLGMRAAKRQDDASTAAEIMEIMTKKIGPSHKLQAVKVVLKRNQTVNDVLMSVGPGGSSRRSSVGCDRSKNNLLNKNDHTVVEGDGYGCERGKNAVLTAGTPGIYLTHSETLAEREKRIKEGEEAQAEKTRVAAEKQKKRERDAAEKLAKRIERAKRKAQRDEQKAATVGGKRGKKRGAEKLKGDENKEKCGNGDIVRLNTRDAGARCPLATLAQAAAVERGLQATNHIVDKE